MSLVGCTGSLIMQSNGASKSSLVCSPPPAVLRSTGSCVEETSQMRKIKIGEAVPATAAAANTTADQSSLSMAVMIDEVKQEDH